MGSAAAAAPPHKDEKSHIYWRSNARPEAQDFSFSVRKQDSEARSVLRVREYREIAVDNAVGEATSLLFCRAAIMRRENRLWLGGKGSRSGAYMKYVSTAEHRSQQRHGRF